MRPGNDFKTRILAVLESSDDVDVLAAAKLMRGMDRRIDDLTKVLSCPSSVGIDRREPCSFTWDGEGCKCDRCGQLVTAWALLAATALEEVSSTLDENLSPAVPTDGGREPVEIIIQRVQGAVAATESQLPQWPEHAIHSNSAPAVAGRCLLTLAFALSVDERCAAKHSA